MNKQHSNKQQQRITEIRKRLRERFCPESLIIHDDSHDHIGHLGAQQGLGHFSVEIISELFSGKSLLECHRLIYGALEDLMYTDIHALRIVHAKAPE